MSNINTVVLTGNLTADPEVVNFQSGGMHGAPRTLANSITKLVQTYAKGSTVSWRHTSVTTELVEEKKA